MAVRIRKDVGALAANDPILIWYGKGVAAMRARPMSDPRSWRYQAAIHDYDRAADPLAQPNDPLPTAADQKLYWRRCQHGSWYFLPWHRMYLHFFEKMVAAEITKLGGPSDWALPYWDYSASPAARLLPPAFRHPTLPGGGANPLFVAAREPLANAGKPFADARDTDLASALREPSYAAPLFGGRSSFGGPVTKFEHSGQAIGSLEAVPHGSIHGRVGGDSGWMGAFNTAALDPIFWLHHANIDRLWEVWLKRDASHVNPKTKAFLSSVSFHFHNAAGKAVKMTGAAVINTAKAPLSYSYENTSDPLGGALAATREEAGTTMARKQKEPELVGATAAGFQIGAARHDAVLATQSAALSRVGGAAARRRKAYLNIEELSSSARVPAYDVYLNVPPGDDPASHEELYAGRMPMFGVVEASQANRPHKASLSYVLEVTDLVARLSALPGWDPAKLRVSFVATRARADANVRVGRVSLYFD